MIQDGWNLSHKGWEQFLPELSDAQKVEGGWHLGDKVLFRALMSLRQEEKRAQTKTSWISKSMMSLSVLFFFLSFILLLQYWYRDFFGHEIFWYRFATFFLLKPNFQILKLSFLRQFFWYQHWDPKWIGKSLETEMSHSVLIKSSELTAEQPSEDLVSVLEQRNKKNQRQRHHVLIKHLNSQRSSQVKI